MGFSTRDIQARCAALGFWPGPIDGKMGKRTEAAVEAAGEFQRMRGKRLFHESGLHRLHWHWTVGWHKANSTDRQHYHFLFEGDGHEIEANPVLKVLAHTKNANSGALGLSLCGMVGAVERPFNPGPEPITEAAVAAMIRRSALLAINYDIPVSRWSTLTHAEIQPTLGVAQRQKWDVNYHPGLTAPTDPITAGDWFRARLANQIRQMLQTGVKFPGVTP